MLFPPLKYRLCRSLCHRSSERDKKQVKYPRRSVRLVLRTEREHVLCLLLLIHSRPNSPYLHARIWAIFISFPFGTALFTDEYLKYPIFSIYTRTFDIKQHQFCRPLLEAADVEGRNLSGASITELTETDRAVLESYIGRRRGQRQGLRCAAPSTQGECHLMRSTSSSPTAGPHSIFTLSTRVFSLPMEHTDDQASQ